MSEGTLNKIYNFKILCYSPFSINVQFPSQPFQEEYNWSQKGAENSGKDIQYGGWLFNKKQIFKSKTT